MKKTLIAAAVLAGLAGVAHAESSVTLYGTLDGGLGFSSTKKEANSVATYLVPDASILAVEDGSYVGIQGHVPTANNYGELAITPDNYTDPSKITAATMGTDKKTVAPSALTTLKAGLTATKATAAQQQLAVKKVIKGNSFGVQQGKMSGNKFGLKGNEDLGNGINAIFQLEGKFSIVDGTSKDGALFGSKAFLGLSSDAFGTLTAGLQDNAAGELAPDAGGWDKYDFFGDIATAANTNAPVVKYVSPDLQGFQFAFSWQGANSSGKVQDKSIKVHDNSLSLGLAYSLGNLSLNGVVTNENWKVAKVKHKTTDFILGGTYDFGVAAVTARFGQTNAFGHSGFGFGDAFKLKDVNKNVILSLENTAVGVTEDAPYFDDSTGPVRVFGLALSAPVGANGKVFLNYQYATAKLKGAPAGYHNFNGKATGHAVNLAFQESLSKRTTVYAYGGYQVQKLKETYNTLVGEDTSHDQLAFAISQKLKLTDSQFGIGLNHKF